MKAITLWQPWASLVALGAKTIETRSWRTSYRGPLAIHAASPVPDVVLLEDGYTGRLYDAHGACLAQWYQTSEEDYVSEPPETERWVLEVAPGFTPQPMPLGAIVATCQLLDGVPISGSVNASGRGKSAALGYDHNRLSTDRQLLGWSHCTCGDGCRPTTWRTEVTEVLQYQGDDGTWVDADEWDGGEPTAERTKRKRKTVVDDVGACADPRHWRSGVVLDPFVGSGTTLAVASGHGRDSIGIDLDERNAELALGRVGPLLLQVERAG